MNKWPVIDWQTTIVCQSSFPLGTSSNMFPFPNQPFYVKSIKNNNQRAIFILFLLLSLTTSLSLQNLQMEDHQIGPNGPHINNCLHMHWKVIASLGIVHEPSHFGILGGFWGKIFV